MTTSHGQRLNNMAAIRKKTLQMHRRNAAIIPSNVEVTNAVYNRPRIMKKAPQAYLFG